MELYRISFIGHRYIEGHSHLEDKVCEIICDYLRRKEYVEIYVGRNGDFDILSASAVKRAQKLLGNANSSLILVLPYVMRDIDLYERFYDEVIIPIPQSHPKSAITKRNRWMIDNSDLLIAFVEEKRGGGAMATIKYAEKKKIEIINLALSDKKSGS